MCASTLNAHPHGATRRCHQTRLRFLAVLNTTKRTGQTLSTSDHIHVRVLPRDSPSLVDGEEERRELGFGSRLVALMRLDRRVTRVPICRLRYCANAISLLLHARRQFECQVRGFLLRARNYFPYVLCRPNPPFSRGRFRIRMYRISMRMIHDQVRRSVTRRTHCL